ncbi:D-aminoacylase [Bradyrhizobium sp. CB82]|uniref:N-acyl-D-amino-acid deacylase family protein n=1 Tax=Bradyrhizobium sp. CB82 TaxID=3039159 RepID=UPI0024B257E0|nr:D-aminoacylase [Bradyrhizobium sp. CB82]WFU41592.1 D-aminoacylase [Bradyrhizobium sp. CB82]
MTRDILIRSARLIDGTGAPWFEADLRISDSRIAAIGPALPANDAEIVDARGCYLAPGFIDAHCHDDLISLREPDRPEKALQGVTTVVVGNCCFSLYPATGGSAEMLRQHFSGLLGEADPSEVFGSFDEYRQALDRPGMALNLVSLVGHAAIRLAVLGFERRAAADGEIAAMQALLARQLSQGAAGLSLGLVYPPSAYADIRELCALAQTVRAHGRLLTAHIRSYEAGLLESIDEFIAILRASGAAGLLSHLQSAGKPNWGAIPKALARLEAARAEGIDVSFDMYPYPAGSSYMLQLLPPAALEGGLGALRARLRDPVQREVLRTLVEKGDPDPHAAQSKIVLIGWGNVLISGTANPGLKSLEGKTMVDAARELGVSPFDLMARCIEEDDGQTIIIMFQLDEGDLRAAFTHRLHMVGSDGIPRPGTKPHPRAYGSFPRVAGRLTRDAGWLTLEDAVRRMTAMPAQRFGLADRGLLRPGMTADLVLFDDTIMDEATFEIPTLSPTGIRSVFVAGQAVIKDRQRTSARPGRTLIAG